MTTTSHAKLDGQALVLWKEKSEEGDEEKEKEIEDLYALKISAARLAAFRSMPEPVQANILSYGVPFLPFDLKVAYMEGSCGGRGFPNEWFTSLGGINVPSFNYPTYYTGPLPFMAECEGYKIPIKMNVLSISHWNSPLRYRNENIKGAILAFDVGSRLSYKQLPEVYRALREAYGNIPVVVMGGYCHTTDRKVKEKQICFPRKKKLPYHEISGPLPADHPDGLFPVDNCQRSDLPFQTLTRQLIGRNDINFIDVEDVVETGGPDDG